MRSSKREDVFRVRDDFEADAVAREEGDTVAQVGGDNRAAEA